MKGLVYRSTGSRYVIKDQETGEMIDSIIKGKFRTQNIKSTNPIAVGDYVSYSIDENTQEKMGVIHEILPRRNFLVRKSVNLSKRTHVIASNIDYILLVITLKDPVTSTVFIDRCLLSAEAYGIEPILIFNKIDLYNEKENEDMQWLIHIYTSIGYQCIVTSTQTGENINLIKTLMEDKTCVLAGHSGVGKSSILNTIDPNLQIKTNLLSEYHSQGQHTTTFAEMHDLSNGGRIIDTPGIRGFGIVNIQKNEIAIYFKEFKKKLGDCKYYNCQHIEEPQCAIKQALENGDISENRYISYLQMMEESDDNYRM